MASIPSAQSIRNSDALVNFTQLVAGLNYEATTGVSQLPLPVEVAPEDQYLDFSDEDDDNAVADVRSPSSIADFSGSLAGNKGSPEVQIFRPMC